jgi:hypothetical protein
MSLTLAEVANNGDLEGMDEDIRESKLFSYMVLTKRLEVFKAKFSPKLEIGLAPQIFCAMISDRPGKVVMWAHTLNEMFVKLGRKVTLADWADAFPMGVPTDDEYARVWELQKLSSPARGMTDNCIDNFANWSVPKKV